MYHCVYLVFQSIMSSSSIKIFKKLSRCGISVNCFMFRQNHGFPIALGQPTGYTHPHMMKDEEITPGLSRSEYSQRRRNLINMVTDTHFGKMPNEKHLIIISASPEYYMAPDIPYSFRQNSNFLYLTGYQEPDAALMLEVGTNNSTSKHEGYNSILFTRPKEQSREIWDGPRTGTEGAVQHFNFHEAYPINELGQILAKRFNNQELNIWYDHMEPANIYLNKEITDVLFNNPKFTFGRILRIGHLVETLRVVKSQAEISLLKKCTSITSHGKCEAMRETRPGLSEAHLHNILEHKYRNLGATRLSFPPVVAGGSMANTLHYIRNDRILQNNDLVLVDSGCEYHGYCSDVTRVWPVNGKFNPTQRHLYEALLDIQKSCIKMCQIGETIESVYQAMLNLMDKAFEDLGLIPKGLLPHQIRKYTRDLCPHHIGHYIGMDVHDTSSVSKNLPFSEGMTITIEPGVYVRDNLDVHSRFHGLGLRIEDDILITNEGPVVLTSNCPKDVDQIEGIMAT